MVRPWTWAVPSTLWRTEACGFSWRGAGRRTRSSGLGQVVRPALPDVRRRAAGRWELLSDGAGVAARPTELAFVTLASTATAADPWRARLAALAAVRVRGGRVDGVFEAVFNPGCRLPRYLTGTGLTQAEADEAPPFADLADELLYFL